MPSVYNLEAAEMALEDFNALVDATENVDQFSLLPSELAATSTSLRDIVDYLLLGVADENNVSGRGSAINPITTFTAIIILTPSPLETTLLLLILTIANYPAAIVMFYPFTIIILYNR